MLFIYHQVAVDLAATARALTAQADFIDTCIALNCSAYTRQLIKQQSLVPHAAAFRFAQFVIVLLGFMHDISQVQQAIGATIAFDGVHIAE
ncbi:hypothetical protein D3C81_1978790 [compost metagenome]